MHTPFISPGHISPVTPFIDSSRDFRWIIHVIICGYNLMSKFAPQSPLFMPFLLGNPLCEIQYLGLTQNQEKSLFTPHNHRPPDWWQTYRWHPKDRWCHQRLPDRRQTDHCHQKDIWCLHVTTKRPPGDIQTVLDAINSHSNLFELDIITSIMYMLHFAFSSLSLHCIDQLPTAPRPAAPLSLAPPFAFGLVSVSLF